MTAPYGRFEVIFGVPDSGFAVGDRRALPSDGRRRLAQAGRATIGKLAGWIIARRKREIAQQPADVAWRAH